MNDVAQVFANGLIAGTTVGVLAISYTLIYGVLRFINFAFGEILMLGAFVFYLASASMPPPIAAIVAVSIVGIGAAALQILAYSPFYRRSRLACLIAAMGVSIVLQNGAQIAFAGRSLAMPWNPAVAPILICGAYVTAVQLWVGGVAIMLMFVVDFIVRRTSWGLQVRAIADHLETAELLGLRVNTVIASTFFMGSCLAAASGVLLSFEHVLKPTMGASPGIQAFAACVVGGIGSVRGGAIAAIAISVLGHFISFVVPTIAPETSAYAVLLLALVFLPEGVAGFFAPRVRSRTHDKPRGLAASADAT